MTPSENCYDLIREFEGCVLHAYPDPGTGNLPITIGWGSTRDINGRPFKMYDTITQDQADELLELEANAKARAVLFLIDNINQNQLDALTSFAYNIGVGNLKESTLLKKAKVNPNDESIRDEFLKWNHAAGKVLPGLTKRRMAEAVLYFT